MNTNANSVTVSGGVPTPTLAIAGGGILKSGSFFGLINGVTLTAAGMLDVRSYGSSSAALIISAPITGSLNFIKDGDGTVTLASTSANNNFSGGIYLNAGTLSISSDANLGATSNFLLFDGGTLSTTSTLSLNSGRTIILGIGGGVLNVAGTELDLSAANQLLGAGALTKTGSGTLKLFAANNTNCPVTVQAGALELQNAQALNNSSVGHSQITLAPDAQLNLRSDAGGTINFGNDVVVQDQTTGHAAIINTGPIAAPTAPGFVLNNLRIGNATLRNNGASGSLTFGGIVTLNGAASFDAQLPLNFADRVTGAGSLTKLSAATLVLGSGATDGAANTYTGDTIIAGGILQLNKKAGTIAIPGNIVMSGGTLSMLRDHQIASNSVMSIGGGIVNFNASQAVQTVNNTAGAVTVVNSTVTVGSSTLSGGSFTISTDVGQGLPVGNFAGFNPSSSIGTITSTYSTDILSVSDGANTVNAGGLLSVGSGGLFFSGSASPAITFAGNATSPGQMLLTGDVTNNCSSGTAQFINAGTTTIAGTISLANATRTFTVASINSDLRIDTRITAGGIRKSGMGTLILTAKNDYTLGTTIATGTLEADDGALGSGAVTIENATLNLRSNATTASFLNDVVSSAATINIDHLPSGTSVGTFQLARLSLVSNDRLTVRGADGGALEFTGTTSLINSGVIDNTVTTLFSGAINGASSLTKDGGTGTTRFNGSAANTYTGATTVSAGALELNKTAGVNAIPANVSASAGGTVRWLANDQVADGATVAVNGLSSTIDLNGFSDTVAALDLTGGTITTASDANPANAGTIHLVGAVTSHMNTVSATIGGKLDLGSTIHTFSVEDGSAANDLVVSADISGAGGGIAKSGNGTLLLTGNNSFTGGVTVSAGTLITTGADSFTGPASISVASGTLDVPGAFSTAAGVVVTKTGAGALTIRGTQTHGANAQLSRPAGRAESQYGCGFHAYS